MLALGTNMVPFASQIYIKQADAVVLQQGQEITLMKLYPEENATKTQKKIQWLTFQGEEFIGTELWDFNYHLLTKNSLPKEDNLDKYLNPVTATIPDAWVGSAFNELTEGDIIELERKGYFRVDKGIGQGPGGKAVLFKIPTGASK
ncbi:putative glutamate--tRNA ligase, cytoplasmic [Metarhizium anisopliae]|nr:putative glutamate--tRNA ligase, cytoplasmic [Metarhizium anisopliae]